MLVLDRATPISVTEAQAIKQGLGHGFGIAGYVGGPCANQVWPANLFHDLLSAGFPMVSVWVGCNVGCWTQDYTAAMGVTHAQRAIQDLQRAGMDKAPCILDVEYNTFAQHGAGVIAYAEAWIAELRNLGGEPWIYGNDGIVNAMRGYAIGTWLAAWHGGLTPIPPDPQPHNAHQYANSLALPGARGAVDVSVFNNADMFTGTGVVTPPTPTTQDDDAMTEETALGLARLVADHVFGRILDMPQVTQIAGDISSIGLASTIDKWEAVAWSAHNGEHGIIARINALEAGKPFPGQ